MHRKSAWTRYEENNSGVPGCVLRYVRWDQKGFLDAGKTEHELANYISAVTRYISEEHCAKVINGCEELDELLQRGVALESRPVADRPTWNYLSVFLAFSSGIGQIEIGWNLWARTSECEAAIFKAARLIEQELTEEADRQVTTIQHMEMIYDTFPEGLAELLTDSQDNSPNVRT